MDVLLEESRLPELKVWILTSYLLRAYCLPEREFESIYFYNIDNAQQKWYKAFQEAFGEVNCTYNVHLVWRTKVACLL